MKELMKMLECAKSYKPKWVLEKVEWFWRQILRKKNERESRRLGRFLYVCMYNGVGFKISQVYMVADK